MPLHRRNPRLFALATCEDCKVPSNLRGSPGLMTAGLRIAHGSCKLCQIGIPTVSGTRSHRVLLRVVVAFPDLHLRSTSGMHRCQFRTALSCVSSFPMPRSCALPCKFKELGARRHKPAATLYMYLANPCCKRNSAHRQPTEPWSWGLQMYAKSISFSPWPP